MIAEFLNVYTVNISFKKGSAEYAGVWVFINSNTLCSDKVKL